MIKLLDWGISPAHAGWDAWVASLYRIAGSRIAGTQASISVADGIVSKASFWFYADVPPYVNANGGYAGYSLDAAIVAVPRADAVRLVYTIAHPDYAIRWPGGCTGCVALTVEYTPYISPQDMRRIATINFDCLTRWSPCRTKDDIMPAAMAQVAMDARPGGESVAACTARGVATLSRDAADAAIVDVVGNRSDSECAGCRLLKVRLVTPLKRSAFWEIGSTQNLGVVESIAIAPLNDVSQVRPGSPVIILFDQNPQPRGDVPILEEPCGVVPFNEEMLQVVRSGIAQDNLPAWVGDPNFP
ncbi:MAG TPA: hypothetical protein VEG64_07200 [Candidatus Sulfotelmatobacter sp.]|nr:hypothetical protein [Candidatus Sulfotelmatobacter sp.]